MNLANPRVVLTQIRWYINADKKELNVYVKYKSNMPDDPLSGWRHRTFSSDINPIQLHMNMFQTGKEDPQLWSKAFPPEETKKTRW